MNMRLFLLVLISSILMLSFASGAVERVITKDRYKAFVQYTTGSERLAAIQNLASELETTYNVAISLGYLDQSNLENSVFKNADNRPARIFGQMAALENALLIFDPVALSQAHIKITLFTDFAYWTPVAVQGHEVIVTNFGFEAFPLLKANNFKTGEYGQDKWINYHRSLTDEVFGPVMRMAIDVPLMAYQGVRLKTTDRNNYDLVFKQISSKWIEDAIISILEKN